MPETLPLFQIDAFSSRLFAGNPAAVVLLERPLADGTLQAIAAENNLSETAYVETLAPGQYRIRWFTPTVEVDLCGHATLAAAWVLRHECGDTSSTLQFDSTSGPLAVHAADNRLALDFPARPAQPCPLPQAQVLDALGLPAADFIGQARDTLVVLGDADAVMALTPDMDAIRELDSFAITVTAPGADCDFVSRFFAPAQGINEDPVTGSAHCTLAPYWAQRLGRTSLSARQLSARGGELHCTVSEDRVHIAGDCRCFLRGHISLQDGQA